MTKSDIRALVKGLEEKLAQDNALSEILENIDEISAAVGSLEDDRPLIRVPYVNAIPVTSGTWK